MFSHYFGFQVFMSVLVATRNFRISRGFRVWVGPRPRVGVGVSASGFRYFECWLPFVSFGWGIELRIFCFRCSRGFSRVVWGGGCSRVYFW